MCIFTLVKSNPFNPFILKRPYLNPTILPLITTLIIKKLSSISSSYSHIITHGVCILQVIFRIHIMVFWTVDLFFPNLGNFPKTSLARIWTIQDQTKKSLVTKITLICLAIQNSLDYLLGLLPWTEISWSFSSKPCEKYQS